MNATFWLRFKAFVIDYVLILAYLALLLVLSLFLLPSLQEWFKQSLIVAQFAGFIVVTLPVSLYFMISDSAIGRQSFGKKRVGIQVVDKNGAALSLGHSTLRTILKFLPWELSHYFVYRITHVDDGEMPLHHYLTGGLIYILILVYILSAIFTKRKQSLYDLIAKTQVVKISPK